MDVTCQTLGASGPTSSFLTQPSRWLRRLSVEELSGRPTSAIPDKLCQEFHLCYSRLIIAAVVARKYVATSAVENVTIAYYVCAFYRFRTFCRPRCDQN